MFTATLLKNGKVLVVGGSTARPSSIGSLATAEIYDAQTNSWAPAASMQTPRSYHTATLLADGRVLIVGGIEAANDITGTVLASAELYDPPTNSWTPAAALPAARARHAAVLLADHRVLVIGGTEAARLPSSSYVPTAEIYDPATGSWSLMASMNYGRVDATATLLPDNRVLVVGDDGVNERTAEIFDPRTGNWLTVPDPGVARAEQVAVSLRNGAVLVAGGVGETSAQLFDWRRNAWINAGALTVVRASATATVLPDGEVLIVGGFGNTAVPWASAELYNPLGISINGIRSTRPSAVPVAAPALLLGIPILLLTFALWLRRARMDHGTRASEVWVD